MRIFEFASFLMMISVNSEVNCLTFKCSFKINAEDKTQQSLKQIICDAKLENYDEDDFMMVATNTTAVENLRSSYEGKESDSLLLQFIETKPIEEITEVVSVVGHNCTFHPKDVGLTFTSLKSFTFSDGLLWRISKLDLEQFGDVLRLDYGNNKINSLETDLFKYNPKLEYVNFSNNRVTAVSSKLGLEKLKALSFFTLLYNVCISYLYNCVLAENDCTAAKNRFISNMAQTCDEPQNMINADFQSSLAETSRKFDAQITQVGKDIQTVKTDMTKDMQELNKNLIGIMDKQAMEIKQNITNIQNTLERIYRIIDVALEQKNEKSKAEKGDGGI